MRRFRRPLGLTIGLVLLSLLWGLGCARPDGPQTGDASAQADPHQVPFHDGKGTAAAQLGQTAPPADNGLNNGLNPETGLPFHNSQSLPAGTLLTVRLRNPISADDPGANARFEAVVDEPVVIEGNSVVPRGATVAGRVESALASNVRRNRGYVRLVLDSIHLAGVNLPIQTSSLFVRGNSGDTQTGQGEMAQIHLEKGRRLTFRLTEPVYVAASQRVPADR